MAVAGQLWRAATREALRGSVARTGSRQATTAASAQGAGAGRVALVQGASRGLGLEFVRQLLERPDHSVVAACRNPDAAEQLHALLGEHPGRLSLVSMDVTDEASIQAAAERVSGEHGHLDLLFNVAGILHAPDGLAPASLTFALTLPDPRNLALILPAMLTPAFAPLLINAAKASGASSERPAVIASLSARVGSIGDNSLGGWYSYRASKTALNQLTKTMSVEFARRKQSVASVLLHPGTVDTDLSAPFQKNVQPEKLFARDRAVRQLLDLTDKVTMKDNGSFWAWDGQTIPWFWYDWPPLNRKLSALKKQEL